MSSPQITPGSILLKRVVATSTALSLLNASTNFNERIYMIQRPSQEEIEKGLAEFRGDYKRLSV